MAFQDRGGWDVRKALWWAFLIGLALNTVSIAANWQHLKAWFDVWPDRPGQTIGYVIGRALSLPLVVGAVAIVQNLLARLFGKRAKG